MIHKKIKPMLLSFYGPLQNIVNDFEITYSQGNDFSSNVIVSSTSGFNISGSPADEEIIYYVLFFGELSKMKFGLIRRKFQ